MSFKEWKGHTRIITTRRTPDRGTVVVARGAVVILATIKAVREVGVFSIAVARVVVVKGIVPMLVVALQALLVQGLAALKFFYMSCSASPA